MHRVSCNCGVPAAMGSAGARWWIAPTLTQQAIPLHLNCSLLTRVVAPSPYASTVAAGQSGERAGGGAGHSGAAAAAKAVAAADP